MLLKYLNQLEQAVQAYLLQPEQQRLAICAEQVDILDAYLESQQVPVQQRGMQLMASVLAPLLHFHSALLRRSQLLALTP